MELVLLTALGVGGATVIGAVIGFLFKKVSHRFSDIVLSFAAGVMLAAAVLGLILPSLEYGGKCGLIITVIGIFTGAFCLNLVDKIVPYSTVKDYVAMEIIDENGKELQMQGA
jgi:ZIP family zinc transporter